ncbi:hypothetical protein Tco_1302160 [Tanacetum coccineum]
MGCDALPQAPHILSCPYAYMEMNTYPSTKLRCAHTLPLRNFLHPRISSEPGSLRSIISYDLFRRPLPLIIPNIPLSWAIPQSIDCAGACFILLNSNELGRLTRGSRAGLEGLSCDPVPTPLNSAPWASYSDSCESAMTLLSFQTQVDWDAGSHRWRQCEVNLCGLLRLGKRTSIFVSYLISLAPSEVPPSLRGRLYLTRNHLLRQSLVTTKTAYAYVNSVEPCKIALMEMETDGIHLGGDLVNLEWMG